MLGVLERKIPAPVEASDTGTNQEGSSTGKGDNRPGTCQADTGCVTDGQVRL